MIKILTKYVIRLIGISAELFLAFLITLIMYITFNAEIHPPLVSDVNIGKRVKVGKDHYVLGPNYLRKNEFGVWEMYIEGDAYERGLVYGELSKELLQKQEEIFVKQIDQFVPSEFWQQFLRLLLGFFNSDLPAYIPLENQQEIYGISQSFSDEYDYIASKYTRILNYHAAHDIGHALNDYSMVGCTSFALKDEMTAEGDLTIGRNFDFYVGDDFAKEKLVLFVNPTKGHSFVSYSWAGFTGVASGMNDQGLSVTINASKSDLPTGTKEPISLLAREILQYASTIEEAVAIAKKRHTFVSETLMIGSAKDGKAVLIEKSPTKTGVYDSKTSTLVCANHYQSATFKKDPVNVKNIQDSDSKFRYARVNELLKAKKGLTVENVLSILRDQMATANDTLGMGNPRAINQLIAHHSVIMQPERNLFYVSTGNFQMGEFVGYDLKKTFSTKKAVVSNQLAASPFVYSKEYKDFLAFKKVKHQITEFLLFDKALNLSEADIKKFIAYNSESYVTYEVLGKYFMKKGKNTKAKEMFNRALTKNLASKNTRLELEGLVKECSTAKK